MFAYPATSSYPAYSLPALYPHSHHYVVTPPPSIPTARERYLQAVAAAQAARATYLSELEEQRFLAALRQQEALRQADLCGRRRHVLAAQDHLARRRVGQVYAEKLCRPVSSLQGRRQVVWHPREGFFSVHEPEGPHSDLDAIISALQGGRSEGYLKQRENERLRAEEARKANALNDRIRFFKKLEHALDAAHAAHNTAPTTSQQPSSSSTNVPPPAHPSPIIFSRRQTEILHNPLPSRDRAARFIQQRWRSHSANAAARKDAIATIATLRARFQFLQNTFSFPEHLEFREHSVDQEQQPEQDEGPGREGGQDQEQDQAVPALLFTPANAAVHAYTHELTKLLTLADGVPSHGSRDVREERRSFVRVVQEALDDVDRRIAKVWGKRTTTKGSSRVTSSSSSGTDVPDTSSAVPPDAVPFSASKIAVHASDSSVSVSGIDSALGGSESLGSDSTDGASTIIPAQTKTTTVDDAVVGDHDEEDVIVGTELGNVDTSEATQDDHATDASPPSSTISQPQPQSQPQPSFQPSEPTQLSSVGKTTDVDVVVVVPTTSDAGDLTSSGGSPVPPESKTIAPSFDIVYPDSPPESPLDNAVETERREIEGGASVAGESGGEEDVASSGLQREVGDEVAEKKVLEREREVEEEGEYELL